MVSALALCLGCAGSNELSCGKSATETAQQPLTNAADAPHYLRLSWPERAAIVHLKAFDATTGVSSTCTGTFIRPSWVLTAAHCAGSDAVSIDVDEVDSDAVTKRTVGVATLVKHPTLDLMLLNVAEELEGVVPIISSRKLAPELLGQRAQLAGTGWSNEGHPGALRFSVTTVVEIAEDALWVSADGYGGACDGDSGGPLLIRGANGAPEIAGVLSTGNVTCYQQDRYVPTHAASEWIADVAGPESDAVLACGDLDEQGGCFGDVAAHCESAVLVGSRCSGSRRCGWSPSERGFRCVEAREDPCRGVDGLGTCEGGEALTCVEGRVRRNACAACGAACVVSPRTGKAGCVL